MKLIIGILLFFSFKTVSGLHVSEKDGVHIYLMLNAKKIGCQICFPEIDLKTMNCIINQHSDTTKMVLSILNELLDSTSLPGLFSGPLLTRHLVLENQKREFQIQMPLKNIINSNIFIFEFDNCFFHFKKVKSNDYRYELFLIESLSKNMVVVIKNTKETI